MYDIKLEEKFHSYHYLKEIKISGHKDDRKVLCFCGKEIKKSIVNHLRSDHNELWKEWVEIFIYLNNNGMHPRSIIRRFMVSEQYLFSWTVVEREIKKAFEQNPQIIEEPEKKLKYIEPQNFKLERTTVWNFRKRGDWAVHDNRYRGNWPPQLVRNLILQYTNEDSSVLDVFAGGGTSLIESWILKRKSVGIDINPVSIKIINNKINKLNDYLLINKSDLLDYKPIILEGNSEKAAQVLHDNNIAISHFDLICAHPPYLDALKYSVNIPDDLSLKPDEKSFLSSLKKIIDNCSQLLNKDGILCVLIGDVRKKGKLITLGVDTSLLLKNSGYEIVELIIKTQNKDSSTGFYSNHEAIDYLISHEYLIICRKGR